MATSNVLINLLHHMLLLHIGIVTTLVVAVVVPIDLLLKKWTQTCSRMVILGT